MGGILAKISTNKVFRNFSYLTISSILSQLIGLITILKISKIFTPNEYGIYTFIYAQSQLINAIGDLGIKNIVIRSISRDKTRTKDLLFNGLKLRLLASIVLIIIYTIYNYTLGSLNHSQILLLFILSLIGVISNLFENIFLGHQKMLMPSLLNFIFNLIWAITIFILPLKFFTIAILLFIQILNLAVKAGFFISIIKNQNILLGHVNNFFESTKIILKESWPYFIHLLVMLPVVYLSNNFLDINSTKAEIGYFNLSQKLMSPVTIVIGFALSAIFPNLSALWSNDSRRFYSLVANGFKFVILFSLALCFIFTLFAKNIVIILFSKNYLPAVEVCQLQVWYVFLMGINSFIGTVWGAENKEKLILKTAIVNAIISTPILYIGSKYGALGLSYGYVGSFALFEIYLWYVFQKAMPIKIKYSWLYWGLALILFLFSYLVSHQLSFPIKICISIPIIIIIALQIKKGIKPNYNE